MPHRDRYAQRFLQRTVEIPLAQFLDLGVVPVLCNDKFWTVQQTVEMPQVQLLRVVDVSVIMQRQVSGFPGRWSMSLLCRSSFGASRATDHGGNHGSDSAVEQIVASRATDHGGNHGSDSAVEQIVASRATDHGRIRDGSVVSQVQFLRLWTSL